MNLDRMSLPNFGVLVALAALCAALAAFTAGAAPSHASTGEPAPSGFAAKTKCNALILKGKKLVGVYERVYKYKFVKVKGKKSFKRKIVRVKQRLKVSC